MGLQVVIQPLLVGLSSSTSKYYHLFAKAASLRIQVAITSSEVDSTRQGINQAVGQGLSKACQAAGVITRA